MTTDWIADAIALFVPLLTLAVNELRRVKLLTWYVYSSEVILNNQGQTTPVRSHTLAVYNNGRQTATNVRLGHHFLPAGQFSVTGFNPQPYVVSNYTINPPQGGANAEIIIPDLHPREQFNITYLYFAPLFWNNINSYVRSDQGVGRFVVVTPIARRSPWVIRSLEFLVLVGLGTVLYQAVYFVAHLLSR
jgi:hypothetical protein